MNHLANKSVLSLQIQKLKKIIKVLEKLAHQENYPEAGAMAHILKMMTELFEEVEQRLIALEKKPTIN